MYLPYADGGDTIDKLGAVQRGFFVFEVESLLERYAKEKVVEGCLSAIVFGTTSKTLYIQSILESLPDLFYLGMKFCLGNDHN